MTFTALGANNNNLVNVRLPLPPVQPACLKVDKVFSACRNNVMLRGYWSHHKDTNPPTPFPPVRILAFHLFDPLIDTVYSGYSPEEGGFFFSVLFSLRITAIYLDQENGKGKLHLSPRGEAAAFLKSPAGTTATALLSSATFSYTLQEERWGGCDENAPGPPGRKNKANNMILFYTVNLTFDFFSMQKVKLLVPTLGPCFISPANQNPFL